MKRILIVDDEVLVRMGLRALLKWERYGYEVVGDASDGAEALAKIPLLKPDLIFADLNMSPMGGQELIRRCREAYPHIKIVVLSSYNDFENVRTAMRSGACDYVFKLDVKPEQMQRLLSELTWETPVSETFDPEDLRGVRRNLISQAVSGGGEVRARFEKAFPTLQWDRPFRMISVCLDNFALNEQRMQLSETLIRSVESALSEFLQERAVLCPFRPSRALLLCQICGDGDLCQLQQAYAQADEFIEKYLGASVTAVISNEHPSLAHLAQAYEENEAVLAYGYLLEHGRIHGYRAHPSTDILPEEMSLGRLEALLRSHQTESAQALCESMFLWIETKRCFPLEKLRTHLLDMLFTLRRYLPEMLQWHNDQGLTLERIIQCADKLSYVRKAMSEAFAVICAQSPEAKVRKEVRQVVAYMKEHLSENIGVAQAARMVNFSESYFSHVFKRDMGVSFIDWLNRERVAHACHLLHETDLRVNEIAQQVGIDNPNYFSALFKKLTGRSPLEERSRREAE